MGPPQRPRTRSAAPACRRGSGGVRRLGSRGAGRGSKGHATGVGNSSGALGAVERGAGGKEGRKAEGRRTRRRERGVLFDGGGGDGSSGLSGN